MTSFTALATAAATMMMTFATNPLGSHVTMSLTIWLTGFWSPKALSASCRAISRMK